MSTLWKIVVLTLLAATASANDGRENVGEWDIRYIHALAGVLNADDSWTIKDANGHKESADKGKFIYGGGDAQLGYSNGKFEYGIEGGGMVSFNNDASYFVRSINGSASVTVKVDNEMWVLESFLGGYLGYRPWRNFRIYASAGPSIMFGSLSIDNTHSDTSSNTDNNHPATERQTDATVGLYERIGLDIILNDGFVMGVSIRKIDSELNFGDSGIIEFDNFQYFLTLGKAF